MKSIWYEMGLREGEFRAVEHTRFLNGVYSFYHTLQTCCRRTAGENWALHSYYTLSFNGRPKWNPGKNGSSFEALVDEVCRFPPVPFGTPVTKTYLENPDPVWDEATLAPTAEHFIGEALLPYSGRNTFPMEAKLRKGAFAWEKQQYRLIQSMRYCIVPLELKGLGAEAAHYGFVNCEAWPWGKEDIEIKLPQYWALPDSKIGIYAQGGESPPIEGSFWVSGETPYRVKGTAARPGSSTLRIYGVTDLAHHADFEKYFDL